jgi:AraC-like DNA-binding protein
MLALDFAYPPTIKRLSKLTASNVLAVQQAFKHHYGKTILAYTLEKRIELAKQLILRTV